MTARLAFILLAALITCAFALVTAQQTTALTTVQQLDPLYVDVSQSSNELLKLKKALAELADRKLDAEDLRADLDRAAVSLHSGPRWIYPSKNTSINRSTGRRCAHDRQGFQIRKMSPV